MDKFHCIRTSINFNYDLKNDKINLYNNNYIKNVSMVDFSDAKLTLKVTNGQQIISVNFRR